MPWNELEPRTESVHQKARPPALPPNASEGEIFIRSLEEWMREQVDPVTAEYERVRTDLRNADEISFK